MTNPGVPERFTLIEGAVHNTDGTRHEFQLTTDGFSQWGTDNPHLQAEWDMLKAIEYAAAEYLDNESE